MTIGAAKLNLCLFLGPRREDGLHELCSLFEPLALGDPIEVDSGGDEVVCAGVEGENLAARALAELRGPAGSAPAADRDREADPGRRRPRRRPADAAAVLRLARGEVADLERIAARLGADVPSQLVPALALVRGAGERVARLPDPEPMPSSSCPAAAGSRPRVFAEADRLGSAVERGARGDRRAAARPRRRRRLAARLLLPAGERPRACRPRLRPEIGDALDAFGGGRAVGDADRLGTDSLRPLPRPCRRRTAAAADRPCRRDRLRSWPRDEIAGAEQRAIPGPA